MLEDKDDDSGLVRRAREGDDEAFALLVKRHTRRVAKIAGTFFSNRENVEDLLQEVFLKVYQSLERFRLGEPFVPWLIRITINACYDELRKIRKRREASMISTSEETGQWLEEQVQSARLEFRSPEDDLHVRIILRRVLERLAEKDRAALVLRGEGCSLREIAQVLGCSMQAANLRLFRARRTMLGILKEMKIISGKAR